MNRTWKQYLEIFLQAPSVVGAERPLMKKIEDEMQALNLEVESHLGLVAVKGSNPEQACLSIHIDRHGLICTGPDEFQYAAFIAQYRSDLDGNSVSEQTYRKLLERFLNKNIIAYSPWSGEELWNSKITESYYCDRRENAIFAVNDSHQIPAGVPLAYNPKIIEDDDYISAQLDNVLLVAIAAGLFQSGFSGTALFTCQEEAGRSWRYIREYFLRENNIPEKFIILDTSPFPSREDADSQSIVLRTKDANADFDPQTTNWIKESCEKLNLSYCFKEEFVDQYNLIRAKENKNPISYGRTELGRLITGTDSQITGSSIQIPTTGYHTNEETANKTAILDTINLLENLFL